MKIALAQTQIAWEDKNKNICKAERMIAEQAGDGVEFILFPEMSFTGFSMNTEITAEDERETAGRISAIALKYGIGVGFGWVRRAGERCENCYTVVSREGECVSEYVKIHPFSYSGEDKKFIGGNRVVTYEFGGICFSTFICYDLRFPEVFRMVCDDVSAVIVPANWPEKRSEHWKTLLRARAIENQVYILAVNCCGNLGGLYYSGDSCVINPDGKVSGLISGKEGVLQYDLHPDTAKFRERFPVLQDRKIKCSMTDGQYILRRMI